MGGSLAARCSKQGPTGSVWALKRMGLKLPGALVVGVSASSSTGQLESRGESDATVGTVLTILPSLQNETCTQVSPCAMSCRCGATSPSCCKGIYEAELGLGGSTARRSVRENFVCRSLVQDVHGQYPDIFRGTSGKYPPRCQKGRRPKNRSRLKGGKSVPCFWCAGSLFGLSVRSLLFLGCCCWLGGVRLGARVCSSRSGPPLSGLSRLFFFRGFLKERATSQEPFFAQEGFVVRYPLCMMACVYLVVLSCFYSSSISFHLALSRVRSSTVQHIVFPVRLPFAPSANAYDSPSQNTVEVPPV